MRVWALNCGRTTPLMERHGDGSTRIRRVRCRVPTLSPLMDVIWASSMTQSISKHGEAVMKGCGPTTPQTRPCGKLTSAVLLDRLIQENAWQWLLEKLSISMLMVQLTEENCGRTTMQTKPHGWSRISETSNYHYQLRDGNPGCLGMSGVVVGDTFYFSATTPYTDGNGELWAHNTSNYSTWLVADIFRGSTGTEYSLVTDSQWLSVIPSILMRTTVGLVPNL